ncbi:MAG: TetR/AcrR family transcriptional regulator [Actinomycetes bacterium]
MPTKRDTYRHGDLRRAVLQASIELIESDGLSALSLREVARRVGVTHGAPYHYFPDRAALLRAVADEGFTQLGQTMAAEVSSATEPLAELMACGMGYVRFGIDNPGLFRLMFRPELTGIQPQNAPESFLDSWQILIEAVQHCQAAGYATGIPSTTLATLCWSTVHGLTTLWVDRPLRPADDGVDSDATRGENSQEWDLARDVVGLLNNLIANRLASD